MNEPLVTRLVGLRKLQEKSRAWLLKNVLLPLGDTFFHQKIIGRLRFLEQAQWWDIERLSACRDRALAQLIQIAYAEVPFYRALMEDAGVRPEHVRTVNDLHKVPVVTKEMLLAHYPKGVTRPTGYKSFESATSGSTGTNFRFQLDSVTAGQARAAFLLALQWAGWRFGERHMQTGMTFTRSPDKRLKDFLLGCHYIPANELSDERLDLNLKLLDRFRIRHLWGYPGSLFLMAQRALKSGWNQPLQSVVTWGDNLYLHYRKTIEQAFRVRVHDTYGCAEGMQVAAQCGSGSTYHVHLLDTAVEFLDGDDQPVKNGEPGNIILTRLSPGPMPLIRYRVGDVGFSEGERRCPCGRGLPTMAGIQGRDTDVVVTPSGRRFIVHFFTGILEHFREIDGFQIVQERPEAILLRIKPTPAYSEAIKTRITSRLKEMGATDIAIEIEIVDEIPLTKGGKRRFIISKLAARANS